MNPHDDRVATLARQLSNIRKEKCRHQERILQLNTEEKEVAFQLNSALGIVPIQEAAERVKKVLERARDLSTQHRSSTMKRLWESKTPEERQAWKDKIKMGRRKGDVNCDQHI